MEPEEKSQMYPRLRYAHLIPDGMAKMHTLEHYLNTATCLEPVLLELVRLRASQMNGCEYCITLHTAELKKHNESPARIDSVADWRDSDAYTHRERAALAWAEAVTNIQDGHAPDPVFDELRAHFSEVEAANLTLVLATINAWNRLAIAIGPHTGNR
jgi:AhpD family alkylhydroperoxidase